MQILKDSFSLLLIVRILKQRNDELFEENRYLQQEKRRQQQSIAWRSTLQQAFSNETQTPIASTDNAQSSSPLKASIHDSKRERSKGICKQLDIK